jgi:hypothetical protein
MTTLRERVEEALETAGVPRAGALQRGWFTEVKRSAVHVHWGYGEPAMKAMVARSFLGQCSHILDRAGFQLGETKDMSETHLEIMG